MIQTLLSDYGIRTLSNLIAGFIMFMLLLAIPSYSQQMSLRGKVMDTNERIPIPGTNVVIKGTQRGTSTDHDGTFSIDNFSIGSTLIFSYVGYKSTEIVVTHNDIEVFLQSDAANLEEAIVIGFGTQKKINIAGAVDQISGKQLEARPIANVMQGLQGVSPGLNITYGGGAPGTVPNINIRGFTSINGGSPLIVIDGIPASDGYDLLRLNPSDIASFTVLRDAASAAIYGARAAFGVILVTTKQGVQGKQIISYNSYVSFGKPGILPKPVTDPYIFSRVLETSTDNTPWDYVNFSDEHYSWAKARSEDPSVEQVRVDPNDPSKWAYMGSNDWYSYFFNKAAISQNQSLSLSGSALAKTLPVSYYISVDYTKENGLNKLANDYWNRYGLRSRTNISPLQWLKIDNNLSIYQTEKERPLASITDLYYLQPIDVARNPDNTWGNNSAGRLAARLVDGGGNLENMFGFQNILSGVASFFKGSLQLNADLSFKREHWKYNQDSKKFRIGYGPDDIREEGGNGYVMERNGYLNNNNINLYGNYVKTLGRHSFNLMTGYNQENYLYSTVEAYRDALISSSLPYLGLTTGDARITPAYGAYATRSYFGRMNYTFRDTYILEANGRFDGSSRFPSSNRWGFFPSVSFAWIASSEPFFENLLKVFPNFKLRASYGELGNQSVGNFDYIQTLPTALSSYLIDGTQRMIISSAPSLSIDPRNYTWERVSTLNFGADFGLIQNKIQGTFDYYIRDTKGMLTAGQELPAVLGTSVPRQNVADLRTKGWEFTISYRDAYRVAGSPLNFDAKAVFADSRSFITRFKNDQNLLSGYREGQEIGEIWGLQSDGLFQTQSEIDALDQSAIVPWGALAVVPGWPKYKDLDGDGKIEQGASSVNPKDLSVIGNSTQRFRIGFNLSADWNNFDISLFLQGVLKGDYYPRHYLFWGPYQQPYANVYPWHLDYYRATSDSERERHSKSYLDAGLADANTDSRYPVLQSWMADANYGSGLDLPQTRYLLSAAYLRVKNVTIGYSLPGHLMQKWNIGRLRLYVTGENMFEFSSIKKFVDPEAVNEGYSAWAYPFQRKLAIGVNLEF